MTRRRLVLISAVSAAALMTGATFWMWLLVLTIGLAMLR